MVLNAVHSHILGVSHLLCNKSPLSSKKKKRKKKKEICDEIVDALWKNIDIFSQKQTKALQIVQTQFITVTEFFKLEEPQLKCQDPHLEYGYITNQMDKSVALDKGNIKIWLKSKYIQESASLWKCLVFEMKKKYGKLRFLPIFRGEDRVIQWKMNMCIIAMKFLYLLRYLRNWY